MPTYTVGAGGDFLTIAAAMTGGSGVVAGDTINLLAGYTGETATVTIEDLTFNGDATNTGIALTLDTGIIEITLTGTAPINITGNAGFNIITGNSGDNTLNGLEGIDQIDGGSGNDTLNGGDDNDLITDFNGTTTSIDGGTGDDTIRIGNSLTSGTIDGGTGTDTLRTFGAPPDLSVLSLSGLEILNTQGLTITATAAQFEAFDEIKDSPPGGPVHLSLKAVGGSTILDVTQEVTARPAIITGSTDNESITTGDDNDTLNGGGGNDTLDGGLGDDTLNGGNDNDTASYQTSSVGVTVSLDIAGPQNTGAGNDTLSNVENLTGSATQGDTLTGDGSDNVLTGLGGNDNLNGGDGNDTLNGGDDADTITDTSGTTASIDGGTGNDTIRIGATFTSGTIDGGAGTDELRLLSGPMPDLSGLTLTGLEVLSTQGNIAIATADQFEAFDTIQDQPLGAAVILTLKATGGPTVLDLIQETSGLATTIFGSSDSETITAGDPNDLLFGFGGNDSLTGGDGDDTLDGGDDDDTLAGGNGNDTASYQTSGVGVTVSLATTTQQNTGAGFDTLTNIENLTGSNHDDTLTGNSAANVLRGGANADTLDGGGGSDTYEFALGDPQSGEVISDSGIGGIDAIRLLGTGNFSFSATTVSGIEALTFTGNQFAAFDANQLPSTLAVTGIDAVEQRITILNATSFSAANWSFTSWELSVDLVFLIGTAGNDSIIGSSQRELIQAAGGGDTLDGRGSGDTYQFSGDVTGLVLNDTGASGTDTIQIFNAVDFSVATTIAGIEALQLDAVAAATFLGNQLLANLAVKGDNADSQTITIQNATNFSAAGWTFTDWDNGSDLITINGSAGNDTVTGSSQNDTVGGGAGNDVLNGGGGANTASFAGADTTYTIKRVDNGTTSWVVTDTNTAANGDDGIDTVTNVQTLSFVANSALVTLANLIGALNDDDGAANAISENAGNGATVGISGLAVDGNGDGITYSLANNAGGRFQIDGNGVVAVLDTTLIDFEAASSHTITVRATSGDGSFTDKQFTVSVGFTPLNGTPGNDVLTGSGKIDVLSGFAGNDTLNGGVGSDTLIGGLNRDILTGGAGRDIFDFNSIKESVKGANRDQITDFTRGTNVTGDDIDLRTIDAKTGVGGNQAFKFIGKQGFHDQKGELRYIDKGASVIVQGDVNGDGKADFEIFVKVGALASGDFLL